jgi:hypothetical protein
MSFADGLKRHRAGDLAGAEAAYRDVIAVEEHADALCNLGLILKDRREFDVAETMLKRAVAAAPDKPIPIYNLGNLYQLMGRPAQAIPCFERAVALGSGSAAKLNIGMCALAIGDFERGWAMYDERPEHANSQAHKLGFPEWKGEPLAGKRLFIWPEQGFGDQIFAARFVPRLGAAEVTFVCSPQLVPLFRQLPATIVPRKGDIPVAPHDYWSIPLTLPRWTRRLPAAPYLATAARPGAGRIGVAWKGNDRPDPLRSLSREAGERLLKIPGAVSLHPEDSGAADFLATAELIAGLDLVITIDTSVAHLAGALGKPTFLMQHFHAADWRWLPGEAGRAFWYPNVQLLRQPKPGDWAGLLDEVQAHLRRGAT